MVLAKQKIDEYYGYPSDTSWNGEKKSEYRKKRKSKKKIEDDKWEDSIWWDKIKIAKKYCPNNN